MTKSRDKIIIISIVGIALFMFMVFGGIAVIFSQKSDALSLSSLGGRVAIVNINGVIENSEDIVRQLVKYGNDGSVKALVLRIDSPGGGVAPSQEIYDQLLKFRDQDKYIVASMGSVAASGGYYVACAADTIFANPGTLTGSIGVIFSFPVFRTLMDKVGIKMEVVKSGALKDVGNPGREISDDDRRMLQSVIDDTYDQFVKVVADGRNLDTAYIKTLADGSIFTGRQAMENGLIDKLGTLDDAIAKAGEMADLGDNPRIVKERPYRRSIFFDLLESLGLDVLKAAYIRPWPALEYRFNFQD